MKPTRRDFLRWGLGSTSMICCGAGAPLFLGRAAATLAEEKKPDGKILVVIELRGGNDGLNTVIPYANDDYYRLRPSLAIPAAEVRKLDQQVGLHPLLSGFERLAQKRQLCVVQSVGYPNPNRSHFESMSIWHTAQHDSTAEMEGWLGRTLTTVASSEGGDVPAMHIREGTTIPQALLARDQQVPSLANIDDFRRRLGMRDGGAAQAQSARLDELARRRHGSKGSLLDFVESTTSITYASSARLDGILRQASQSKGYPEESRLGRRLQSIAQMIKAGLTTSIYYTEFGDFDTHAQQASTHPYLLRQVGDSLSAFMSELTEAGDANRVMVLVFSEFGRRLEENGSGGTDHGTAAPVFLAGSSVKQLIVGPYPNLKDVDSTGDPQFAIDFRRIYATLLHDWLGCDNRTILDADIEPLPLFS